MEVHVVSKQNHAKHASFRIAELTKALLPSSVRVRAKIVSLTSNNLTYAALADVWNLWNLYPVPQTSPAPYNDQATWGIVPAWGYATVLESSIADLPSGTSLWGYWPASGHAVDLQLSREEPEGHWVETSPGRQFMLSLYNRYIVVDTQTEDLERLGWGSSVRPTWVCGYLLSEYVFTPDPATHPPLHPLPGPDTQWTVDDADLSKAVFISIGASTKTGRAAAFNLSCRPAGTGPLALLQISSAPAALSEAADKLAGPFPTKAVSYSDIASTGEWLAIKQPSKIVVANFGSRDGGFEQLLGMIQGTPALHAAKTVVLSVHNTQDFIALSSLGAQLGFIQVNTSPIQDAALGIIEPKQYFGELEKRWNQWLMHHESAAPDLRLVWGKGISGEQGLEGGWDLLCKSHAKPNEALKETSLNRREDEFDSKLDWDNFLEKRETMIVNLVTGVDVAKTEAKLRKYESSHLDSIQANQVRESQEASAFLEQQSFEQEQARRRRQVAQEDIANFLTFNITVPTLDSKMTLVRAVVFTYRKSGLSLEEFTSYSEQHGHLLKRLAGDVFPISHRRSYIAREEKGSNAGTDTTARNPTTPAKLVLGQQSDFDFDAYTELTFASPEAVHAYTTKTSQPEIAAAIAADEERFLDRSKTGIAFLGDVTEVNNA
ncbi:uncharacterized protein BHQ10_008965 [Talaromyces amestolkiae]|uniref:EthD domain-containing protein n=1 Tax=Talaromyces amestolkiae TaxID=1196081 RepID=A0A364LB12_TALAM|nr:uncharacterized protein BHQ10_008965 [Talaromyces amestolkiae]RAO72953.1 hypothetical protein BHQ10_008965 [Talaromyces amestolkiae]